MNKKMIFVLMLASLSACGDKEAPPTESREETASPPAEEISQSVTTAEPAATPPAATAAPTTPPVASAPSSEPAAAPSRYTVLKGDTLYGIARRHHLDYQELAQWNGIRNPDQIRPGQQLSLSPPRR